MFFSIQRKSLSLFSMLLCVIGVSHTPIFAVEGEGALEAQYQEPIITNGLKHTATATMDVTLELAGVCTVEADSINFGIIAPHQLSEPWIVSPPANVTIICPKDQKYAVEFECSPRRPCQATQNALVRYLARAGDNNTDHDIAYVVRNVGAYIEADNQLAGTGNKQVYTLDAVINFQEIKDKPSGTYSDNMNIRIDY